MITLEQMQRLYQKEAGPFSDIEDIQAGERRSFINGCIRIVYIAQTATIRRNAYIDNKRVDVKIALRS